MGERDLVDVLEAETERVKMHPALLACQMCRLILFVSRNGSRKRET